VLLQGYIEESNVDPIFDIARMIEVQRAYEMGQTFLDREDERIRGVISTLPR
jgi:flagellar basal-body rod protein FlgF